MGRPKLEISETQVLNLAKLMCTHKEIASFFNCSTDTIADRFSDTIIKGHEVGKISLRRKQWKLAGKNAAMAIWLGKQYLDQREKVTPGNSDAIEEMLEFDTVPTEANGRFKRFYN